MKILVTGSSGMLGSHVVEALAEEHTVSPFDLPHDVCDVSAVRGAVSGVDGIVHLAGVSRQKDGQLAPDICMRTNVLGTLNVLHAAGDRWVILGSTRDAGTGSFYSLSKLHAEQLAHRYCEDYGLRVLVMRFSDLYGSPRDNPDRVLPKLNAQARRGETLTIDPHTAGSHDFTHYTDAVQAVAAGVDFISSQPAGTFDVLTIRTGLYTPIRILAAMLETRLPLVEGINRI